MQSLVTKVKYKLLSPIPRTRGKRYIFVSNTLDQTGAPIVLLDIIKYYIESVVGSNSAGEILVIAPAIDATNQQILKTLGVKVWLKPNETTISEIDYRLNIRADDFVLLNTSAIDTQLRDRIFDYIDAGKLTKLNWFIHEQPDAPFFHDLLVERVTKLVGQNKLAVFVPAIKIQQQYEVAWGCKIDLMYYRFELPAKFKLERVVSDFDKLNFVINGSAKDGRKGQMPILKAFGMFLSQYYSLNPQNYRDFSFKLIGLGDDEMSEKLIARGTEILGEKFSYTLRLRRDEALAELAKTNVNIVYSRAEALPLNVFESMYMGSVLLRNDCSGVDEQLLEGENGWLLDSKNLSQVVMRLETILNKEKTPNKQLLSMAQKSQEMTEQFSIARYSEFI